jgi:hypothetical protein
LLSAQQFETVPELAGNPFLPRLFQMFDHDQDNKLTQEEFNAAIETFLKAQTPEERMQRAHLPRSVQHSHFVLMRVNDVALCCSRIPYF